MLNCPSPRLTVISTIVLCGVFSAIPGRSVLAQRMSDYVSSEIRLSYPSNWDSLQVPPTVAAFTDNPELWFTIERISLNFPQPFDKIFAEFHQTQIVKQYPGAKVLSSAIINKPPLGQMVQVDLLVVSPKDRKTPLRVRALAVPVQAFAYRIFCVARESEFQQRERTFDSMLSTLRITPPASPQGAP